jgi:RHS repeat-associated protein
MTFDGNDWYYYDSRGNLIQKDTLAGSYHYQYDTENRLSKVTLPNASTIDYYYSPFGDRIGRITATEQIYYLYDGSDILQEYNLSGTNRALYTHGHVKGSGFNEPISLTWDGTKAFYHTDGLGSIVAMTDSFQTVVNEYTYNDFGEITIGNELIHNTHTYTAKEYDQETGLYFYRSRYYQPDIGRFIQKDIFGMIDGMNQYIYVHNNPVNFIDPCGRKANPGWRIGDFRTGPYNDEENLGMKIEKAKAAYDADLEKCKEDQKELKRTLTRSSTHNRGMKKWNAIKAGANALPLKGPLKWSVDIHIAIGDTMAEIPATEPLFSCKAVGIFLSNLLGVAKDKAQDTAQDAVLGGLGEMGDDIGKGLEFLDTVQNIKEFMDAMKELSNTNSDAKKIDQALKNFLSKCKERAKQKFKDAVNAAKLSKVVITGQKPSTSTANTPPIPKPQPNPSSGQQPPKPHITGGGETPDPPNTLPPPDEDGPSQQGVQTTGHRPLEPETTPTLPIPVTTPDPPWINRLPRITINPTDDSIGFPPGGGGDLGIPSPEEYCEYRLVYFSSNAITNIGSNHQALYNAIKWAARHPPSVNTTVLLMPSWAGYDGYSQWQTFISQYPGIRLLRWSDLSLERELVTYSGLQQIGADVLIDNEHYSSIQQGGFYNAMETEAIQKYLLDEHGYVVTSTTLGDTSGQLNQTDQLLALLGLEKKDGEPHLFLNSNPWVLDDPVHAIFYNISSGWDPGVVTGNVDTGACPLCGEKHYGTQIAHLESTQGNHHALMSAYTLWYVPFSTNGIVSQAGSTCISVPQTVYFPNQIITDTGNNHDALYKAIKWAAEQTDDQETRVLMMPGWGGYDGWSQWQSFAGNYSDLNITRWSSQSSSRDVVTTYGLEARAADILIMDNHSNPLQQGGYYTQGELQAINWYIKTKGHGLIVTSQTLGQDSEQHNQTTVLMKLLEINNTGTIEPYMNSEPWIIDQPYHPILYGINTWNPDAVTGNLVTETAVQLAHLYTTQGNHHTIISAYEGFEKGVCSCLCNIPPLADFTWAPPTPAPQDSIQFSDLSEDIDGFLVNWSWDFGDGNKSYIQNPTHHYNALGKYTVCLTVIDDGGVSDRFSQDVDVVDLFAPEFSNIGAHPSPQNVGGFVNISATVIDTVGVDEVYLFIEYPDLVEQNFSITQNKTGDTYYCNQSYSQIGSYSYQLWANDTSRNSNTSQIFTFQVVSSTNNPPLLGTPTPNNGSTNQPFSFTWSIPISDPEGDLFSWTIQCSNGQQNSGTGTTNGTKTLALSGLDSVTTYTVWVNATDPGGSDQYTRQWYTFTTKINQPPIFGSSSPANGSINQPLSLTWSIPINDPEGNTFSWTIQCNNGQFNSGTNAGNGTKTLILSGLEYSTTYTIWVNATDPGGSGQYTRRWYLFTTKTSLPPIFGTPSPANGSTNQPLSITWSIPISDPEGDQFSWTIQCSNGQSNSAIGASNGTKTLQLAGLSGSTTYTVWVNATDPGGSGQYTRKWYTFTTQQQQNNAPNKPATPQGTTSGKLNTPYVYWSSTTDPDGDQVYYMWDWGDDSTSAWLGPYNSGAQINTTHTWSVKSSSVKIKAKDAFGLESPWSDPLPITMPFSLRPRPLLQLIESILERFPRALPILRYLLNF